MGGLAWATDDSSLRNAFARFGTITDAKVWPFHSRFCPFLPLHARKLLQHTSRLNRPRTVPELFFVTRNCFL